MADGSSTSDVVQAATSAAENSMSAVAIARLMARKNSRKPIPPPSS
jgi:hypothetical protein